MKLFPQPVLSLLSIRSTPALLALALLAPSPWPAMAAPGDEVEPPLEYSLEVDGKSVDARAGEVVELETANPRTRVKVVPKATRTFSRHGITFQYPNNYSFEYDGSDKEALSWTLDGVESVIILTRSSSALPASTLNALVAELTKQYGAKNVKNTASFISLGGTRIPARRLAVTVVGQGLVQEVCTFSVGDSRFFLILQGTAGKGGVDVPETKTLKELLNRTYKATTTATPLALLP